jgi:LPXTG-motif cell wall-anchored protein
MRTTLGTAQRAALALGAATTFALLGVAAPAQAAPADHQDQRSTSLKEGRGHNDKWQAQADPDGDENGGVDQPGGSGGVNKDDQDGNNGSGNDSDCEDDNRGKGVPGHCKDKPDHKPTPAEDQPSTPDNGKPAETPAETPAEAPASPSTGTPTFETPADTPAEVPTEVPAAAPDAPATPASPAAEETAATTPEVLGVERTAAAGRAPAEVTPARTKAAAASPAGVLPNTGADAFALALLAGGLGTIAAGTVLVRRRATEEI